ncbi:MAG: four helix bundle protein [Chitinophagaceae bacterium]
MKNFLLTAQIIDSSRSTTRNIAEGYGRFTYADSKNFFIMARGFCYRNHGKPNDCF